MDAMLPPKPRRLRLQFGLRTALVLMTLAAVGVALWTRWPYAAEQRLNIKVWHEAVATPLTDKRGNVIVSRESAFYRRVLGGERIQHGESRIFLDTGQLIVKRMFREGRLHGEYREFYTTGTPRCEGEVIRGGKDGKWLFLGQPKHDQANSDYRLTQHWNLGVPHGDWRWEDGYGTIYLRVTYDQGRVTTIDGEPVIDYLDDICRKLPRGPIADRWRAFHQYEANGGYPEWMDGPSAGMPNVKVESDPRLPRLPPDDPRQRIRSVPYAVSLAADLNRKKWAATRRFNCLYITSPDRLGPEHDPTGVSTINPEPGSLLDTLFAKNVKLSGKELNFNLRQALNYFDRELGLPIDVSALAGTLEPRDEDRSWASLGWWGEEHNIRDLFGLALHRARCRCELVRGVLVIKRQ
jgi:hypothetical protein